MKQRLALALASIFCALSFAQSSAAQDPEASRETSPADVEQCVAQHDSARKLRLSERWLAARSAMLACADERCPMAIGADCRAWFEELASVLPTLIVVVQREDPVSRSSPLHVLLDGEPLDLPEPPAPVELLPGRHHLRVELGSSFVERDVSLKKGEKNHLEHFRVGPHPLPPPSPSSPLTPSRPIPVPTYAFSAGALVAFGGAAALLESALRQRQEAELTCAPYCAHSVRKRIQTRLVLADIAAGTGLVLAGLGLYSFVRRPVLTSLARGFGPALVTTNDSAALFWQGQF